MRAHETNGVEGQSFRVVTEVGVTDDGAPLQKGAAGVVCVSALVLILDGFDQQMLPLAAPLLQQEWSLSHERIGIALVSALIGMALGAWLGGTAGDKFGRRFLLIASTAVFALATSSIAATSNIAQIVVLRFLGGLAFGSAVPNAFAMATRAIAPARRVKLVAFLVVATPIGAAMGALFVSWSLPALGWRVTFAGSGILPLLVAFAIPIVIPNDTSSRSSYPPRASERWSGRMRPPPTTKTSGWKAGLLDPVRRRLTITLWATFFANGYAVYAVVNWLPVILKDAGSSVARASLALFVFILAMIGGSWLAAWIVGRVGEWKSAIWLTAGVAATTAVLPAVLAMRPLSQVLVFAILMPCGLALGGLQTVCYVIASSYYPERIRASAVGVAVGVNRIGGILTILLGGIVLQLASSSATPFFLAISGVMGIVVIALLSDQSPTRVV